VRGGRLPGVTLPYGHGLHVHAENVILEILNDADQPCKPGETGRVVLTVLHNFRTPFIGMTLETRRPGSGSLPCGRGLPLITRVHGKARPHFKLVEAVETFFGPRSCDHHGRRSSSTPSHSKSRDHVIVRMVPNSSWTADHSQRLDQAICDFFEAPVTVQLELGNGWRYYPAAS